jgi:hypothetical protein
LILEQKNIEVEPKKCKCKIFVLHFFNLDIKYNIFINNVFNLYPFINFFDLFQIYTFWLTVAVCFFLFVWMLKKLSVRFSFDFLIFRKNLLWYFLSAFFFSRLFYVLSKWNDLKQIKNTVDFFLMSSYNFLLMWAIFGFFLVFSILLSVRKEKLDRFISWIVLSFLFVLPLWYVWALFWWEVYWKETNYWIEITYTNSFSPVPYQAPTFPLPIVYAIIFFILFSVLYILSINKNYRTIIAYLWAMIFSCIIFILEFFSWKFDLFKNLMWVNLSQICAIIIFILASIRLSKIYKAKEQKNAEI